jgi:hypothetical protein
MRDSLRGGLTTGSFSRPPSMAERPSGNIANSSRMAPPTERLPAPPIRDDRMPERMPDRMPERMPERMQPQQMPQRPQMPPPGDPYAAGPGRYDEPTGYGQPPQPQLPQRPAQQPPPPPSYDPRDPRGYDQGGYDQGYDNTGGFENTGGFDGFEAGRHGKTDMTAEIRMPREPDPRGGYGAPPPPPPMNNAPVSGGYGPPQPQLPPPMGEPGGELYRVDQLRRTFQPRRFGSGYDPMQVDRLFEGILQAMTGRGPMPVPENDLDMLQFGLVPGGYFEAEVDAALREVKDILTRRR